MIDLKYKEITKGIIGTAFEVHTFPGNGFQEVIYQRAFAEPIGTRALEVLKTCNKPSLEVPKSKKT